MYALKNPSFSLCMVSSQFIQTSFYQMCKPWNSWCPYDWLTPYPHYLTSISLLVTPQQIRKASQHLHGDRPQLSRWPQCAARQLKRKRRAGKWKWVRIRGEPDQQREHDSVARVRITLRTHTHTQMHVHASVHNPYKNKHQPRAPHHAPPVPERKDEVREQIKLFLNAPSTSEWRLREFAARMTDKSCDPINQINPLNPLCYTESLLHYFFQWSTSNTVRASIFVVLNSQTAAVKSAEMRKSNHHSSLKYWVNKNVSHRSWLQAT